MSHYHEQFLKQNPLAVLGVLRDLHKAAIPLRLSWNGGQLISKILAITPDKLNWCWISAVKPKTTSPC